MKQSLQLKLGQSLTMTPQLQQAIKLLQLSSLELEAEIQEVLESNPLLETEPNSVETESNQEQPDEQKILHQGERLNGSSVDSTAPEEKIAREEKDTSEAIKNDKIESDMIADTQWEDWGYQSQAGTPRQDDSTYEYQGETSDTLRDQLLWQVNMTSLSETDRTIAMILIDSIDDSGFMKASLDDVVLMLNNAEQSEQDESQINLEEIEAVLHLIQSFEPAGIAARSLQECLQIQLNRLNINDSSRQDATIKIAQQLVTEQFDYLAARNYRMILKKLNINETQLKQAIELIQNLDPRPGNQLNQNNAQYIKPDVYVIKNKEGQWIVTLNPDSTPKLKINDTYAALIKRADNSRDNQFLKNNLQDAKWFIKSLQSRNDTLLKVAQSIVTKQSVFLDYGEEAMKPLVLHDVAEEVEMHESTISRVTTQKFLHTPKGIFELKYFFSSHLGTDSGGECSSTAIRAVIKKMVASENQLKPLSDSKIAALLKEQGIQVARRTVAKYRESMAIPPSNERKSLI